MNSLKLLTIVFLVTTMTFSLAQYQQHTSGVGNVNWTDQMVRATGIGAPNPNLPQGAQRKSALQAARYDALRNLLGMVKGIYLNSETTVENAMVTSDIITGKVQGIVRGYRVVDTRYMQSGDIEVDVEVPLSTFYDILSELPGGFPAGVGQPLGSQSGTSSGQVYTGLIVDASGLGLRPALSPKIVDESGSEVYGTGYVTRDYAVQIGVVGYEKDLNRAKTNERVSGNPIVVRAVKVQGQNNTDVVVSAADANAIRNAAANLNFLEQCKVMIILD